MAIDRGVDHCGFGYLRALVPATPYSQKKLGKPSLKKTILVIALPLLVLVYWLLNAQPPKHRVFLNANVLTMDSLNSRYEAVAVESGRIQAVGSTKAISQLIQPNTIVSDLRGKTLLPGFVDAHSHFPVSGLKAITTDLTPPPVGSVKSIATLQKKLRYRLNEQNHSPHDWLIGFGYDDSSLVEQRHPTRDELDAISSTVPIYLWHSSGHMGVANSPALERLNIDESTQPPPGGVIAFHPQTGQPTGLLQEAAAPSMARLLKSRSIRDYQHIFNTAIDDYASQGITTAQSGGLDLTMIRALKAASFLKLLPFRINVWAKHQTVGEALINKTIKPSRYNNDRFHLGPIKLFADGSPQGRTAYLSKPYHGNPPDQLNYRGFPAFTQEELTSIVEQYHQAGFQLAIHGNGDAAIDDILDAFENAQRQFPQNDPRMILVHAQMARQDQLKRMKPLGVTPSFFSNHIFYWGDAHSELHLGPERAENISPAASASALGLRYSIHTDAPVTPIDPIHLIHNAVQRRSISGQSIGPHERISPIQAIRAVTIDAAWQLFQQDSRGSIEVGKFADFVVLSDDPTTTRKHIATTQVIETIVAGKTIYRRTKKPSK